jgi:AcrR family transcriptional regulator
MTRRAAAAAATRARIVDAARAVYARDGFRAATLQAIARRARVSPATVLNHFDGPEHLLEVTLADLTAELGLPEPTALAALGRLDARIAALTRALAICYQRGERLYAIYARDRDLPAVRAASDAFFARLDALARAALGPGLRTRRTVSIVLALAGWQTFGALRAAGMDAETAGDTLAEVLLGWLARSNKRSSR